MEGTGPCDREPRIPHAAAAVYLKSMHAVRQELSSMAAPLPGQPRDQRTIDTEAAWALSDHRPVVAEFELVG